MFIEIVEDIWVNLNQLNNIQIIDNNTLWFSNNVFHQGFLVVAFTSYGRFITKDDNFETENGVNDTFAVINDFYIFEEVFKTKNEAREFMQNKLGIYLTDVKINNKVN